MDASDVKKRKHRKKVKGKKVFIDNVATSTMFRISI